MAKLQNKSSPPNSFERLGLRVQKIISSPSAQKRKMAVICKTSDERPEDWKRLLEDIANTENVTLSQTEDGAVRVSWMRIPRHPAIHSTHIRPPVPRSSGQAVGAQRRRFALLV
jgi:hypothetical protein